ncbi:ABC transporter ATP-binding protein [Pseudomonas sp. Pdm06]|uniref:dipeptide ABC transporter ATP-binding protein n=1 Tax=Pseudomonas sp. Pdm06 TaxID=1790044 RepID=UPI001782A4D9|nr:ABC transporter ATP-binding protein [Pseudomonas sp. Pdm06]MBD9466378.1 ABC transporter ATP-binding protein [Pseudomonas sp. Pdm06]
MHTQAIAKLVAPNESEEVVLKIEGLSVRYPGMKEGTYTVHGVDLELVRGTIHGLMGESGCGKSTTALASIAFRRSQEIIDGKALFAGKDLFTYTHRELLSLWGGKVAFVAQSAFQALNPSLTIGSQIEQVLRTHTHLDRSEINTRILSLLSDMGVPLPEQAVKRYPFQFSGGQLQRVALALALACRPQVLILDEPTTGLDVTTQEVISALLKKIAQDDGISILYISHDLALLKSIASYISVMYAGQIVESGVVHKVLETPKHPYTRLLVGITPKLSDSRLIPGIPGAPPPHSILDSCAFAPRCEHARPACEAGVIPLVAKDSCNVRCIRVNEIPLAPPDGSSLARPITSSNQPLLIVDQLELRYPGAKFLSIDKLSFKLMRGERVAIVGESGSGKSSVLRVIAGISAASDGYLSFDNQRLGLVTTRTKQLCSSIQLIFQNADSSLNPKHTVRKLLRRSLILFRPEIREPSYDSCISNMLRLIGLPERVLDVSPSALSGGQRQRVAIGRCFLAKPKLVLCDEITSALDVSVQASVMTLLAELTAANGASVIFVSHDLPVVRAIADRVIVMRKGQVVEIGTSEEIFCRPKHPYTQSLISAVPEF